VSYILRALGLGPDLSNVPPDDLEKGRRRGALVHQAIEAIVYGYWTGTDDPEIAAYLSAYQKFVSESGFKPLYAEKEVRHEVWRYRGHPDLIGWLDPSRVLIDTKTGEDTGVEWQVAGYVEAWNHQHPNETVASGACLSLRKDGTYRFNEIDLQAATPIWQAAVLVYHAVPRG
jgi:hypothetical protein